MKNLRMYTLCSYKGLRISYMSYKSLLQGWNFTSEIDRKENVVRIIVEMMWNRLIRANIKQST